MMNEALVEGLRDVAIGAGADLFGVADVVSAREAIRAQGGDLLATYPRAISVGVMMPSDIVDLLPNHLDPLVEMAYRGHGYDVLNARLDQVAARLYSALQREGHRAFPIRASQMVDRGRLLGRFSHKLAAHQAGLGWIGKSCLLVTPQVGPRVRWATVLTDAPLAIGQPMAERCGACTACVDACPTQAFTGRAFRADEPREMRFDVHKCYAYQRQEEEQRGTILCGMCVYACPYGQREQRELPNPT